MLVVGLVATAGGVVMVVVAAAAETGRRWWWHGGGLRKVENFWSSTTRFPITLAGIFSKCTDRTTRSKLNYFRRKKKKENKALLPFPHLHFTLFLSPTRSTSSLLSLSVSVFFNFHFSIFCSLFPRVYKQHAYYTECLTSNNSRFIPCSIFCFLFSFFFTVSSPFLSRRSYKHRWNWQSFVREHNPIRCRDKRWHHDE